MKEICLRLSTQAFVDGKQQPCGKQHEKQGSSTGKTEVKSSPEDSVHRSGKSEKESRQTQAMRTWKGLESPQDSGSNLQWVSLGRWGGERDREQRGNFKAL